MKKHLLVLVAVLTMAFSAKAETYAMTAPVLGDIVAKFGEYTVEYNEDSFGVELGTVGELSAANAESITVKCAEWIYDNVTGDETINTYTGATANWPIPEELGNYDVTITAKLGDATKTLNFLLSVSPNALGEITCKIGTQEIIDICFHEDPYIVYVGTQIDFAAPYAENIKVKYWVEKQFDSAEVHERNFNAATATVAVPTVLDTYRFQVEANLGDDYKALDFYIIVKEPSSIDKPMTVAEALAECTADGPQGVFVKGIVTEVTTTYNSSDKNVSFTIADAAADTDDLLVYCAKWDESVTNAPADYTPVVGSSVIISGDLTINNNIKEFAAGNMIVKYFPVLGAITGNCDAVVIDKEGSYTVETGKTITFTAGSAETITVEYGEGQNETFEGATATWTVPAVGDYNVTVTATLGDVTKTLAFTLTVASDGITTGFNDIVSDSSTAPAVYYNLQGVRVANPENGLYIRVQGKTATKVIVR